MTPTDPLRRRAIIALVLVNLLWGISFPAMKASNMIMEQQFQTGAGSAPFVATKLWQLAAALLLMSIRFLMALGLLALFVPRLFRGMNEAAWRKGAWTGLAFALGFVLQIVALNDIPASRSGFLTSLTVVFMPLAMIVVERRSPRRTVLGGTAFALCGTAILTGMVHLGGPFLLRIAPGALGQIGVGDWLTVTAALIFTGQILLIDRFSRTMPAGQLTPGMFVAALLIGASMFGLLHAFLPAGYFQIWFGLLRHVGFLGLVTVMSLFCTVLAFHWMNKYQAHVTPAQAALIYTLEPIFATLWAMVLPDLISQFCGLSYKSERPGWELLFGGLLIVMGNLLALWPARTPSTELDLRK